MRKGCCRRRHATAPPESSSINAAAGKNPPPRGLWVAMAAHALGFKAILEAGEAMFRSRRKLLENCRMLGEAHAVQLLLPAAAAAAVDDGGGHGHSILGEALLRFASHGGLRRARFARGAARAAAAAAAVGDGGFAGEAGDGDEGGPPGLLQLETTWRARLLRRLFAKVPPFKCIDALSRLSSSVMRRGGWL